MFPLAPLIALAVLLAGSTAVAEIPGEFKKEEPEDDISGLFREIGEFGAQINFEAVGVEINMNPVLRQIVCRIGFQSFTESALARAMGLSEDRIGEAIDRLKLMGMVGTEAKNGEKLVVPASKGAERAMRKWAEKWCVGGDECGVKR